ncbi:hypothetical protein ACN94_20025 [Gordonia paraffinivorans]|uniref:diflavin oxidoreductase n=1 Tax=Gordonia paraffinivorans TaxID=175628 RepID=UPI001C92FA72|nr:flavodoxin domain-containing protein [Gordonia paraffinivorans]MBY4575841.1 hypothetical protein [Gordonia paraffinivorans]
MPTAPDSSITFIYGTQTGNAEIVAMDAADLAKERGIDAALYGLDEIEPAQLADIDALILVSSTYDDGDMPDNAQDFWDALCAEENLNLSHLRYAVIALGDSSYDDFCAAGRHFDEKLAELGARRVMERGECDVDFEKAAAAHVRDALDAFSGRETANPVEVADAPAGERWTRQTPFTAMVVDHQVLTAPSSTKTVHQYRLDVSGADLDLQPGDSIGLIPENSDELITAVATALGVDPAMPLSGDGTVGMLLRQSELRLPSRDLIDWALSRADDPEVKNLVNDRAAQQDWLYGRDVADLAAAVSTDVGGAREFLGLLKPLTHRTYSLASCPQTAPDRLDLLVGDVDYVLGGRRRRGAATSYLGTGVGQVRVFPVRNELFRLPADDKPIIMVGPGTGLAPFRAFLQRRAASGATGDNWLIFGDRNRASDFLYENELRDHLASGLLTRLDTAFSRDQADKHYVQHVLAANADEVFAYLERGATFFVCGDMERMSKDVEATLLAILAERTGGDANAKSYFQDLKRSRRYLIDVY